MITAAAETGLALFKTIKTAILDLVSQIYHCAPRVILSFGGRREKGYRSNNAERIKPKIHSLPHIPLFVSGT